MINEEKIKSFVLILNAIGLKPKLNYSAQETFQILGEGFSPASLSRMRERGVGPEYKKLDNNSRSKNGKVTYPIDALADYYFNNIKTA